MIFRFQSFALKGEMLAQDGRILSKTGKRIHFVTSPPDTTFLKSIFINRRNSQCRFFVSVFLFLLSLLAA